MITKDLTLREIQLRIQLRMSGHESGLDLKIDMQYNVHMTDEQLADLYLKHKGLIFSAVIKVLGKTRKHHWHDVSNDAWYAIIGARDSFKGISKLETWATSIAHNVAADWLSHQKVLEKVLIDDQIGADAEGPPPFAVSKKLSNLDDYDE